MEPLILYTKTHLESENIKAPWQPSIRTIHSSNYRQRDVTAFDQHHPRHRQAKVYSKKILSLTKDDYAAFAQFDQACCRLADEVENKLIDSFQDIQHIVQQMNARVSHEGEFGLPLLQCVEWVLAYCPTRKDLMGNIFQQSLSLLPGVNSVFHQWYHRYQLADETMKSLLNQLDASQYALLALNEGIEKQLKGVRVLEAQLKQYEVLGGRLVEELKQGLKDPFEPEQIQDAQGMFTLIQHHPLQDIVENRLIVHLEKRLKHLHRYIQVCQEVDIAIQVIMKNNQELLKGASLVLFMLHNVLTTIDHLSEALLRKYVEKNGVRLLDEFKDMLEELEALNQYRQDWMQPLSQIDSQVNYALNRLPKTLESVVDAGDQKASYRFAINF